jgi:hypothetical protein
MGQWAVRGEEVEDNAQEEEGSLGTEGFALVVVGVLFAFEASDDEIS